MAKRPRFRAEYCAQAEKLCALGAGEGDIAAFFGISQATLDAWKERHDGFREALDQAVSDADREVERSLYERAIGYSHPEEKVLANAGKPLVVPTTKHYPPDPTSMMFWLKNRQPTRWRDKVEHHVGGRGGGAITVEFIKVSNPRHDDDQSS